MNKKNVGKPVTTHDHLQRLVKAKKWIVEKVKIGIKPIKYEYRHYVSAWFVNSGYMKLCKKLKDGVLFEYKKG